MRKEEDFILIEKASVYTWDGDLLFQLSSDETDRDIPVTIKDTKGNSIRIPNDEIFKVCKALKMMHME